MNQMKSRKASEECGIYAEMLNAREVTALIWLHTLLCTIWKAGITPTDRGRGVVGVSHFPFRSGRESEVPRIVTTTAGSPSSPCQERSWHEIFSTGSSKSD